MIYLVILNIKCMFNINIGIQKMLRYKFINDVELEKQ